MTTLIAYLLPENSDGSRDWTASVLVSLFGLLRLGWAVICMSLGKNFTYCQNFNVSKKTDSVWSYRKGCPLVWAGDHL